MKLLSDYTIARYCTDIVDIIYGIDEIEEKISQRHRVNKRVPYYFYTRLSKLKEKLKKIMIKNNKKQLIMWEITDSNGTIYSGSEDEMISLFQQIKNGEIEEDWTGDLRLVQVHDIYK
jgi:hypothetical protein